MSGSQGGGQLVCFLLTILVTREEKISIDVESAEIKKLESRTKISDWHDPDYRYC